MKSHWKLALTTVALIGVTQPAAAQVRSYNLSDVSGNGSCGYTSGTSNTLGNVWSCEHQGQGTTTLNVRAFSTSSSSSNSSLQTAMVRNHGSSYGLGAVYSGESSSSPNHSLDNTGRFDLFLFEFTDAPVQLNSISLGWLGADSDFQVLAWLGVGAPSSLVGQTPTNLLANSWTLTNTVINGDAGWNAVNGGNQSSKYWIVSAYNPSFGGGQLSTGNDQMKLLGLKATVTTTPEPSTYALMAFGMAGIFGFAKRRRPRA